MQVQVSKDGDGYLVWFPDIEIVCRHPNFDMRPPSAPKSGPVWMKAKTYWFRRTVMLSGKQIERYNLKPELDKLGLISGQKALVDLVLIQR